MFIKWETYVSVYAINNDNLAVAALDIELGEDSVVIAVNVT